VSNQPKKAEIRVAIDTEFLAELENRLGMSKSTDVARAALTLLNWASKEAQDGRMILSSDDSGGSIHRLVMPELANIKSANHE